jgi:hypothetical protein
MSAISAKTKEDAVEYLLNAEQVIKASLESAADESFKLPPAWAKDFGLRTYEITEKFELSLPIRSWVKSGLDASGTLVCATPADLEDRALALRTKAIEDGAGALAHARQLIEQESIGSSVRGLEADDKLPTLSYKAVCRSCDGGGREDCEECNTTGQTRCTPCNGRGTIRCDQGCVEGLIRCSNCSGRGSITDSSNGTSRPCSCQGGSYACSCNRGIRQCYTCRGNGNVRCSSCRGTGECNCSNCQGHGGKTHFKTVDTKIVTSGTYRLVDSVGIGVQLTEYGTTPAKCESKDSQQKGSPTTGLEDIDFQRLIKPGFSSIGTREVKHENWISTASCKLIFRHGALNYRDDSLGLSHWVSIAGNTPEIVDFNGMLTNTFAQKAASISTLASKDGGMASIKSGLHELLKSRLQRDMYVSYIRADGKFEEACLEFDLKHPNLIDKSVVMKWLTTFYLLNSKGLRWTLYQSILVSLFLCVLIYWFAPRFIPGFTGYMGVTMRFLLMIAVSVVCAHVHKVRVKQFLNCMEPWNLFPDQIRKIHHDPDVRSFAAVLLLLTYGLCSWLPALYSYVI